MTSETRTGIIIGGALLIVLFFALGIYNQNNGSSANVSDEFAQCLTDNGAKMYGAYWCAHCKEQKEAFGNAWDKINYIECAANSAGGQTAECAAAGIESYPTWTFADGSRASGKQEMDFLAGKTGCTIEQE
ncbi:MAG: hypothetical protein ABH846_02090 [Patescibacteria group bacterium]